MNVEVIQRFCLSFPQATENLQWGDDLCFKVGGKIFAMLNLNSVPPGLLFKCSPETFAELVEREGIVRAPYVGRYKWVLVEDLEVLSWPELTELVRASYEMVAAKVKVGKAAKKKKSASTRKKRK
jgi:predicted DNA-binding protein (MmcQ/YjbR family)